VGVAHSDGGKRSRGRSRTDGSSEHTVSNDTEDVDRARDTQRGLVECREGPDGEVLVARYGMEVAAGELRRLQRLESEFGHERVQRWADEGIPVGTMGRPRDMEAYRERKADDASEGEDGPRRGEPSLGNDLAEPVQPHCG